MENGKILSEDGQIYLPDMIFGDTILLVKTSWTRLYIKDVVCLKVNFTVNELNNEAFNFKI